MAETLLKFRDSCRLCAGTRLDMVIKMAACPPVDAFVRPDESPLTDELLPMDLYLCADCGHANCLMLFLLGFCLEITFIPPRVPQDWWNIFVNTLATYTTA